MKRISKFAHPAEKQYGKICVRVPSRLRAIYLVWMANAGTPASDDLRQYLENTVADIERTVAKLPKAQQDAFWKDVASEEVRYYIPGVGKGGRAKEIQKRLREIRKAA